MADEPLTDEEIDVAITEINAEIRLRQTSFTGHMPKRLLLCLRALTELQEARLTIIDSEWSLKRAKEPDPEREEANRLIKETAALIRDREGKS